MSTSERVQMLRDVELFEECTDDELGRIAVISELTSVDAGARLLREGETGRELFVILDGRAGVEIGGERVAELGPGDFFGETALLGLRVATVRSLTPMTALTVHQSELESLITTVVPSVAHRMLASLRRRLGSVAARH